MDQRGFTKSLCAGAAALALGGYSKLRTQAYLARVRQGKGALQRPPTARPEPEFLKRCIRCYQCAEVCPNHAIQVVQGSAAGDRDSPMAQSRLAEAMSGLPEPIAVKGSLWSMRLGPVMVSDPLAVAEFLARTKRPRWALLWRL